MVGKFAEDVPPGFWDECAKFVEVMPKAIDDYETLIDRSEIWLERTQGVGLLSADELRALRERVSADLDGAVAFADASPFPDPKDLMADMFAQ